MTCLFCQMASRAVDSLIVYEDTHTLAFLDHRPVFHGHCLLIPKEHYETLMDLLANLIEPFFTDAQSLARAVEKGMGMHGTFVALNTRVSQSVPKLHVHSLPRRLQDLLHG